MACAKPSRCSKKKASNLLLPVVAVPVSTGLPPCPGLRGEPCREYKRYKNRAVKPTKQRRVGISVGVPLSCARDTNPMIGECEMQARDLRFGHVAGNAVLFGQRASLGALVALLALLVIERNLFDRRSVRVVTGRTGDALVGEKDGVIGGEG